MAQAKGKDAEQLVEDKVVDMLERQAIFVAGVNHGIAQAGRGELVDHDEVAKRISRLLNP
ncbi:MAG: hypothetical protein ACK5YZ_00535 [bacterium]